MNRLLAALTVLAIVWLWRPFPAPGADPFVDLIALQSPGLHGVVRAWHYVGPAVAAVIPGAASVAEVEENARMIEAPIPAALWSELKDAGLLDPAAPVPA